MALPVARVRRPPLDTAGPGWFHRAPMQPPVLTGRTRLVLNALLAGLVLRVLRLDDLSLWADEGVTWWNATAGGWKDAFFAESNHPPVWWWVTRASLASWPGDEAALRLPAVACGVLALVLTWRLFVRLTDGARTPGRGGFVGGDGSTAVWVTVLAAVNPFWIEYAQEARMYAALLAEALGLSLLYLRWLDRGGRGTLVAYGVLASVALHTNYFALWPIAGHLAHALFVAREARRRGDPFRVRPLFVTQIAAGLTFVPWFLYMLQAYRGISPGAYEPVGRLAHALWRMGVGPALVALDAPRVRAGPAAVFAEEPVLVVLTALAWIVPIVLGLRTLRRRDRGAFAFTVASVAVPVALVMLACVRWPLVHEKYLIFVAPFLLYLAVVGARSAPGLLRPVLVGGLVLLHVAGLAAYHFGGSRLAAPLVGDHVYGKEQWREAHAFVARERGPQDVVALHAPFTHMTWAFYDRGQPVPAVILPPLALPCDRALTADEVAAELPGLADAPGAFLVLSHPATDDPDHYRDVFLEAVAKAWGGFRVETHELPRQWGIRVVHVVRP